MSYFTNYPYFEVKKKIVLSGNSEVFNRWKEHTYGALTEEAFLDGLEWVCADPVYENNRVKRAIGLHADGTIAKLTYYHQGIDFTTLRYAEDHDEKHHAGQPFNGDFFTRDLTKILSPQEVKIWGKTERQCGKFFISIKDKI
jgi:hypothetical protein